MSPYIFSQAFFKPTRYGQKHAPTIPISDERKNTVTPPKSGILKTDSTQKPAIFETITFKIN